MDKPVLITWEDASHHDYDRMTIDMVKRLKLWVNYSVGFLVEETDRSISLASEIDTPLDDSPTLYQGIQIIPKSCIVNRVALSEVTNGTEVLCSDVRPPTQVS